MRHNCPSYADTVASEFLRINKRANLGFQVTAFLESIKLEIFVSGIWEEPLLTGKVAHSPKKQNEMFVEDLDVEKVQMFVEKFKLLKESL